MTRRVRAAADLLTPSMASAWQRALDAATGLGDKEPWGVFSPDAILGIHDPVSGQVDWCTVMGHGGEVFGVAMYPGDAGFATLQQLFDEEVDEFDAAIAQRAVTLQFESSATIMPATRKILKAIGRSFRGSRAWPELLEHEPGLFPAPLRDEVLLERAANAIRGLTCLLPWADRDPDGGAVEDAGKAWVTAPPFGPDDLRLQALPVVAPVPAVPPGCDEIAVRRVVLRGAPRRGTWFLDWFPGQSVIDGPEAEGRPFLLCHVLLLEKDSDMLLACELARLSEVPMGMQQALLKTCERVGIPERLIVRRPAVAETVGPLAQQLGIELHQDAAAVEISRRVYADMMAFLGT